MPCDQSLRFGIPSLDSLLTHDMSEEGIRLEKNETIAIAIEGADGTGKSILALHLASSFAAAQDARPNGLNKDWPAAFYVATDLRYERATRIWTNFALDCPIRRWADPFKDPEQPPEERYIKLSEFHTLTESLPLEIEDAHAVVSFVDLASTNTGDEWATIGRLIAARPGGEKPFLLLIDAVEGLETWIGEKDSFGQQRSRRSRIAQILGTAKGKCHVVFVVEEHEPGKREPEEFVTDVVIHVRYRGDRDYSRRTIEVEKVRGQTHARGQHDFAIRSGNGSKSSGQNHPDDPPVDFPKINGHVREGNQSYFYVFQSLHYRTRLDMEHAGKDSASAPIYAGFGIRYLDDMLTPLQGSKEKGASTTTGHNSVNSLNAEPGFPIDATMSIIGEDGTFKSVLGRAFLSRCFSDAGKPGVAILITTKFIAHNDLCERLNHHLGNLGTTFDETRVICRHLEMHHLSASVFAHIVTCAIRTAKRQFSENCPSDGRIRLVIDNWSVIEDTYPEVREDPLLLPFLLSYFRRERIASVILATEAWGPDGLLRPMHPSRLRRLTPHHLFTWHVPFFGLRRVAITSIPPIGANRRAIVRELKTKAATRSAQREAQKGDWKPEKSEQLVVSPEFELYSGLEVNKPKPIPLRVHLFGETPMFDGYSDEMNNLLSRLIYGDSEQTVIIVEDSIRYEQLRDFSHVQSGTHFDFTLVFQVDEFWAESTIQLCDQHEYLWAETFRNGKPEIVEDPFLVFQPSAAMKNVPSSMCRFKFFSPVGHDYQKYQEHGYAIDKVPYRWDFGFLLCRQDAWANCKDTEVGKIWKKLAGIVEYSAANHVTWAEFFNACRSVSKKAKKWRQKGVVPFDISMLATETFSCLFLEIWASLIYDCGAKGAFPRERHDKAEFTLIDLVDAHWEQLCQTWALLGTVIEPLQFQVKEHTFSQRAARPNAVAARHWYSTAAATTMASSENQWVPLRLPGHYSVRGDWFLAVAEGSRSRRLGERAMDVLCSRRGNIVGLQNGLGLPVRDTNDLPAGELWTPLRRPDPRNRSRWSGMPYEELRSLGAADDEAKQNYQGFHWLWRSQIVLYDRHARIWQRWLASVLERNFELFLEPKGQTEFALRGAEKNKLLSALKRATLRNNTSLRGGD